MFRQLWCLACSATVCGLLGCTGIPSGLSAVTGFEAERYLGTWYELARLDHSFERGLTHVSAEYGARADGALAVRNRGYDPAAGTWREARGVAWFRGDRSVGSLKVTFFWPFYGGYHIIALDKKDYRYAMIAGPSRGYLWILCRETTLDPSIMAELVGQAKAAGFKTEELIYVDHRSPAPAATDAGAASGALLREDFTGTALSPVWSVHLSAGNTIVTREGCLEISAAEHTHAHIERALGHDHVRATCALQAGGGISWATSLFLYWNHGDWCQVGVIPRGDGRYYVCITTDGQREEHDLGRCRYADWQHVGIELGEDCIRFLSSVDGTQFRTELFVPRPERLRGPARLLVVQGLERRGGLIMGMCEFAEGIDHAYTYGYWLNCLTRGDVRRVLLGFYGTLAYGMGRETYCGVEVTQITTGEPTPPPPHLYSGTQQLRLLRMMLLHEDGDALVIGRAIPHGWLGGGRTVEVRNAPTVFGPTSFTFTMSALEDRAHIRLDSPRRDPPREIRLHVRHPAGRPIAGALVDGGAALQHDGRVITIPWKDTMREIDVRF